jgi:hypothetical protein
MSKITDTLKLLHDIVSKYKLLFSTFTSAFYRMHEGSIIDNKILSLFGYGYTFTIINKFDNFNNILYYIDDIQASNLTNKINVSYLEKYIMLLLTFDMSEIDIELYKLLKHTFVDFINLYYEKPIENYSDYMFKYSHKELFKYWHLLCENYIYYNTDTQTYILTTSTPRDLFESSHDVCKLSNLDELFKIIPKTNRIKTIIFDSICCEYMNKIPKQIIMLSNLKMLHVSMRYLKQFPKNLDELTKLKNIHITDCYNLSDLGFKLDKFNNITISFNEAKYDNMRLQLNLTMGIFKTNTKLTFFHKTPYDYTKYCYYPIRTPTTYLKFINNIYNNLPADLKKLTICTDSLINKDIISNQGDCKYYGDLNKILKLTNLPTSLKKINIITNAPNIKELIDLKMPFGCKLIIKYVSVTPYIEYSWSNDNKIIFNQIQ